MSDALTIAELEAQHVELLPARTVLSLISVVARLRPTPTPPVNGSHQNGIGYSTPYPFWCTPTTCSATAAVGHGGLHG